MAFTLAIEYLEYHHAQLGTLNVHTAQPSLVVFPGGQSLGKGGGKRRAEKERKREMGERYRAEVFGDPIRSRRQPFWSKRSAPSTVALLIQLTNRALVWRSRFSALDCTQTAEVQAGTVGTARISDHGIWLPAVPMSQSARVPGGSLKTLKTVENSLDI